MAEGESKDLVLKPDAILNKNSMAHCCLTQTETNVSLVKSIKLLTESTLDLVKFFFFFIAIYLLFLSVASV